MSKQEPRSIRLTMEHRNDMVAAVMDEWKKQNPEPVADVSFHAAVLDQLKASSAYRRTERLVPNMFGDDWKYFKLQERILVTITDSEGQQRNATQIEMPVVFAKKHGLHGVDTKETEYRLFVDQDGESYSICTQDHLPSVYAGLEVGDIVDESTRTVELDDGRKVAHVCSMRWVSSERISVQISDDSEAYKAYRAAQKARNDWCKEHARLLSETRDLLGQFNTTKQIREGWPAMVPYFPPHIADPESVVHLPVLAVDRLSERLGIKK